MKGLCLILTNYTTPLPQKFYRQEREERKDYKGFLSDLNGHCGSKLDGETKKPPLSGF
jgi:hypothetical protein